jgi:hypothetical protein
MKRHFYTGMLILFFSCFFSGQLVAEQKEDFLVAEQKEDFLVAEQKEDFLLAEQKEDFPWELFMPAIIGTGNSTNVWDEIFVQAITELDAEGLVITPKTISSDIVVYLAIIDRMLSIAGLEEAKDQKLNMAFEAYDDKIVYCGWGNSKTNPEFYEESQLKNIEQCINFACFAHDNCYDTIDNLSKDCYWSKTTKHCDDVMFLAYETCKKNNQCKGTCESVIALARWAREVECQNLTAGWWDECQSRNEICPDCKSKSVKDSCDAMGAKCGKIKNGCGKEIDCGSCPEPTEYVVYIVDNATCFEAKFVAVGLRSQFQEEEPVCNYYYYGDKLCTVIASKTEIQGGFPTYSAGSKWLESKRGEFMLNKWCPGNGYYKLDGYPGWYIF